MSNHDLLAELSTALVEAKKHAEGKLTLKTHYVIDAEVRFQVRAERGAGKTERGIELLKKAMND